MNDDQMDEMLIEGARDYNAPGAVPREEMWAAIAQARREGRNAKPAARSTPRRTQWAMLAAAAVILAVGISIGRRMDRGTPVQPATPTVAAVPSAVQPTLGPAAPATTHDTLIEQARVETKKTAEHVRQLASTDNAGARPKESLAYHLVVLQHLAGSEAMITSFRSAARGGQVDPQVASWAKELLGTTRLLEASDAGKDPMMKRLLEDLDLVITQIVQYTTRGVTDAEELDLIEQSINKRGVITRLRSTVPSRAPSAGI